MGTAKRDQTDGRKRRWQEHNAARRQAVIDAAIVVLSRDAEPGEEVSVQQIADEASVHRTVLYRYFEDRTDLDLAIQREICTRVAADLLGTITLEGTVRQILRRIIATYVTWAAEHPRLLHFAERPVTGTAERPLDEAIGQFAEQIEILIGGILALLDADVSEDDRDSLTPWVFLLVGGVMAAVRAWISREELRPAAPIFIDLLTEATWHQIEGLVRSRNIEVPDVPVEQLLNLEETP